SGYLTERLCRAAMQEAERLSVTFGALADPTRRAILARLARGDASVTELAKPFDMTLPAVSKHLRVLERAGLIRRGREAQWRPCRIEGDRLKDVAQWVERYRRFWEEGFDRLDEDLKDVQRKDQRNGRRKGERNRGRKSSGK